MSRLQIWQQIASNIEQRLEQTPIKFGHDPELVAHLLRDDQQRLESARQFVEFHTEN